MSVRCWVGFWLTSLLLAGVGVSTAVSQGGARTVKGMRMPLEYYEDGQVKSQLVAKMAKIPDDESQTVQAWDVRAEFYTPDGALESLVLADSCDYDRAKGLISSDEAVRMERRDLVIMGKGFRWDSKGRRVHILKETKVLLARGLGMGKVIAK